MTVVLSLVVVACLLGLFAVVLWPVRQATEVMDAWDELDDQDQAEIRRWTRN
jgi:predicted PurR-regulated permease PerM